MKNIFLFFLVFIYHLAVIAQVGRTSLYFDGGSNNLTSESKQDLEALITVIKSKHFQLIEVNSFCDAESSYGVNMDIARKRIPLILDLIQADAEEGSVNVFGKKRAKVEFTPKNWNRIDVYYFVKERPIIQPEPKVEEPKRKIRKWSDMQKPKPNKPRVVPIRFEEGTYKIKPKSIEYLDKLYDILKENPDVNMHIRGHVCCYNNVRASKKRAKVVYKYLVKKGISKKRLSYEGYGNTLPLFFPEKYKSDREANRRVDVVFDKELPAEDLIQQ